MTTIFSGGTPSKRRADYWTGAVPWVSPKDVKRPFLTDVADHISQEALNEGSRLVPAGAVFVVVRGMALAKDIPVAMAMVPMAFNQDIKALVPGSLVAPEFLLFSLKAHKDRLMREVGTAAHGTRRMAGSAIEDFTIPLPPFAEQRATAAALRSMYEAVEVQEKIVAGLRELKAATMAKLFREGLRGERRKQTEIGEIPKSWEIISVGDLFNIQLGKMLSGKARLGVRPRPYLRNANVQWGRLDLADVYEMDFSEQEAEKFTLRPGDILVCEGGEPGRTAMWGGEMPVCYYQKALHRLRPKDGRVLPEYYAWWSFAAFVVLRTHDYSGAKTTIAHLPAVKLGAMKMTLPAVDEQREIVTVLATIGSRLRVEQTRLERVRTLFSSTLHLLMTGQVRVPVGKEV